jgi:hypothetical protein
MPVEVPELARARREVFLEFQQKHDRGGSFPYRREWNWANVQTIANFLTTNVHTKPTLSESGNQGLGSLADWSAGPSRA